MWVLIASVPDLCILFIFIIHHASNMVNHWSIKYRSFIFISLHFRGGAGRSI